MVIDSEGDSNFVDALLHIQLNENTSSEILV